MESFTSPAKELPHEFASTIFIVLLVASGVLAQRRPAPKSKPTPKQEITIQTAVTKDGRTVLLKSDGTWDYTTDPPIQTLTPEPSPLPTPEASPTQTPEPEASPTPTAIPTTGNLAIQAAIVYKMGGPQPVARTTFIVLDADPFQLIAAAGIQGKKPPLSPRLSIPQSLIWQHMGNRWDDGERITQILIPHTIAVGQTGFDGTLLFSNLPAKRVYVFGIAQTRGGWALWNVWFESSGTDMGWSFGSKQRSN